MSRNRHRLGAAVALVAVLLLVLAVLAVRASLGRRDDRISSALAVAGLPRDLDRYAGQLRHLRLPDRVVERFEDLSWLGSEFPGLSIDRMGEGTARKLPRGLRTLSVREAWDLPDLAGLPPDLESLSIEYSSIGTSGPFPESLRRLSLAGVSGFRVEGLPGRLDELSLRGTELRDLRGAPAGLTGLHLASRYVTSLDGIPEGVRAVSLQRTFISTLEPLPANLHALELAANPLLDPLESSDLPRFLVELSLDRQQVGKLTDLPVSLRRLRVSECGGASGLLISLPATLSSLEVEGVELPKGCWLPPDLRSLTLRLAYGLDAACLPAGLEELHLAGAEAATVGALALPLVRLGLVSPGNADLDDLPALPDSLRYLNLDYTDSDLQRLAAETPSLVALRFRGFPLAVLPDLPESLQVLDLGGSVLLRSLSRLRDRNGDLEVLLLGGSPLFTSLAEVPPSVRVLDISHTGISSLAGLPRGLEELTLSRGQVNSLEGLPSTVRELSIVD